MRNAKKMLLKMNNQHVARRNLTKRNELLLEIIGNLPFILINQQLHNLKLLSDTFDLFHARKPYRISTFIFLCILFSKK